MLGRTKDIKKAVEKANFLIKLFLTFYPLRGYQLFDDFYSIAEFLVVFLCFRISQPSDQKDLFQRLFVVFVAVTNKIEMQDKSVSVFL